MKFFALIENPPKKIAQSRLADWLTIDWQEYFVIKINLEKKINNTEIFTNKSVKSINCVNYFRMRVKGANRRLQKCWRHTQKNTYMSTYIHYVKYWHICKYVGISVTKVSITWRFLRSSQLFTLALIAAALVLYCFQA